MKSTDQQYNRYYNMWKLLGNNLPFIDFLLKFPESIPPIPKNPGPSSTIMVLFLINLVFLALSMLLNVVSRLIFTTAAHLLVLTIQAFKLPGQAIQGGLEQLGNVIGACLQYLVDLGIGAVRTFISSLFDALKDGVSGSAAATSSALGGLMENTRASLESLIKDFPEVFENFTKLIKKVATDLWNNYNEAIGYIIENV